MCLVLWEWIHNYLYMYFYPIYWWRGDNYNKTPVKPFFSSIESLTHLRSGFSSPSLFFWETISWPHKQGWKLMCVYTIYTYIPPQIGEEYFIVYTSDPKMHSHHHTEVCINHLLYYIRYIFNSLLLCHSRPVPFY